MVEATPDYHMSNFSEILAMADNDKIILDHVLEQERTQRAPNWTPSDFFELFVAEQVLKDFDLSDEEIEYGLVAGAQDGGVDGVYLFANGELVQEDFDASGLKKNIALEIFILQSKTSPGFDENALTKLTSATVDLFNLSADHQPLTLIYNADLLKAVAKFHEVYKQLAAKFPSLRFRYVYASRGDVGTINRNLKRKAELLKEAVSGLFSAAKVDVDFYGASELLALARRKPVSSYDLAISETISAKGGYIALVRLPDFYRFLSDEQDRLRKHLFEANVRDYQGSTQVNEEIQKSLQKQDDDDFWWLNNGVTIIADKAVQSGKILTIEDPQIVNGLQTSTEIFKHFALGGNFDDARHVMVRVVVPTRAESADRIIKATNSQTSIPPASLRATDKMHRDIEEYVQPFGVFYDRRKNMHKNLGRPIDQIISISLMAQAIMAILLQRPNDARARPSSLLKKDEDYAKIFSNSYPIRVYLFAAKMVKAVSAYLRNVEGIAPKDRNNLLFYVAMYATALLANSAAPTAQAIADIDVDKIGPAIIGESYKSVFELYQKLGETDQVAKGPQLLASVRDALKNKLGT
jgi:hypothetical protein